MNDPAPLRVRQRALGCSFAPAGQVRAGRTASPRTSPRVATHTPLAPQHQATPTCGLAPPSPRTLLRVAKHALRVASQLPTRGLAASYASLAPYASPRSFLRVARTLLRVAS